MNGTHTKTATMGLAGNNQSYEQAFSELAHTYIRDAAPGILQYELGFQLLDRDPENKRAVGALVARIGKNTVVVPIFSLRGRVRGHELMYLVEADMVLPLSEGWLNLLQSQEPQRLGRATQSRDLFSEFGTRTPNFDELRQSPMKVASAKALRLYAYYSRPSTFGDTLGRFKQAMSPLRAPSVIARGGPTAAQWFVQACRTFPQFGKQAMAYYTEAEWAQALQLAASVEAPQPAAKKAAFLTRVEIVTSRSFSRADEPLLLDRESEQELRESGRTIYDTREESETSVPYAMQTSKCMQNPTATGVYQVGIRSGEFEKALVLVRPATGVGAEPFATVIRLDNNKAWVNSSVSRVWCLQEGMKPKEDSYASFFDSLPTGVNMEPNDTVYVLLGPTGEATAPFRVQRKQGGANGSQTYKVWFHNEVCDGHLPEMDGRSPSAKQEAMRSGSSLYSSGREAVIIVSGDEDRGRRIFTGSDTVHVPGSFRVLRLADGSSSESYNDAPIMPRNFADIDRHILAKTAGLTISRQGSRYLLGQDKVAADTRFDAVVALMRDCGLRRKSAEAVLDEVDAAAGRGKSFTCRLVKQAAIGSAVSPGPSYAVPFEMPTQGFDPFRFPGQVVSPQERTQAVPGLRSQDYPEQPRPHEPLAGSQDLTQARNSLRDAASSGKQELFDLSTFVAMLKTTRPDNMVDQHVPPLMRAIDASGRLLLQLYAHQDEFADRFGEQEVPELEDTLRTVNDQLGDITLKLKQDAVGAQSDLELQGLDLSVSDAV